MCARYPGPRMDEGAPPPPPAPERGLRLVWRQAQRLPVTMMLASLLAGLGIVQLSFQLAQSAYRAVTWTQETRATQARVQGLERDVRILKEAQANARTPEYLREQARCLGMVGETETVIVAEGAPETVDALCDVKRLP